MEEPIVETLVETEDFSLWLAEEPDGETTYHIELGIITLHLFQEEWEELVDLVLGTEMEEEIYNLDLDMVTVHFPRARWQAFRELIGEAKERVPAK